MIVWQEARAVPAEVLASSVVEGTVWDLSRWLPFCALELGSSFLVSANCVIFSLTELMLAEHLLCTSYVQITLKSIISAAGKLKRR